MARNPRSIWTAVNEVIFGARNQAGEDNARGKHGSLRPAADAVPGATLNRLCRSGMDRWETSPPIKSCERTDGRPARREQERAPFVCQNRDAFSRSNAVYDTTSAGFVNKVMRNNTASTRAEPRKRGHRLQDRARGADEAMAARLKAVAGRSGFFDARSSR